MSAHCMGRPPKAAWAVGHAESGTGVYAAGRSVHHLPCVTRQRQGSCAARFHRKSAAGIVGCSGSSAPFGNRLLPRLGAPGGLFTPTITLGALLGGALGCLWGIILPGGTPGSYAFLGAGAILAATTQGPISSIVLMMELTRRTDAEMVPLLLVVAIATAVARRLEGRSIYSARLEKEDEGGRALPALRRSTDEVQ